MKRTTVTAYFLLVYLLGAGFAGYAMHTPETSQPSQAWNFKVYLDKNPIGSHSFVKYGEGNSYEMLIAAEFEVKFLFFTAYSYEHRNQELWSNGCLQGIESETDDNGDLFVVKGRKNGDAFEVVANEQGSQLPPCITTFAYWDPQFLTQKALMNSQTGKHMPVDITGPFADSRIDRGNTVEAQRYRITTEGIDIQLWYSQSGEWLALESALESDRTLRYERI